MEHQNEVKKLRDMIDDEESKLNGAQESFKEDT